MFDNWMGMKKPNGAAPANNPPNNQQNNPPGNTNDQNNSNTKDNSGNNTDLIDKIWDEAKNPKPADNNNPNPNPNPAPGNPPDPQAQLSAYLDGAGLGEFKLTETEIAGIQSGEGTQEIFNKINQRIQQAHVQALSGASKLIEKQVEAAVKKAVDQSKSFYQGEQIRDIIRSDQKLGPIAKDPKYAPIVETVVRQFMAKGTPEQPVSLTKAIELTNKYMGSMAESYTGQKLNTNTQDGFRGSQQQNVTDGNTNWLETLRGK